MSDHTNQGLEASVTDQIRQITNLMSLGNAVPAYGGPVVGTAVMEDQQMEELDNKALHTPTEIVDGNGRPTLPNWKHILDSLPDNAKIYEIRFITDNLFRFDTTIAASGTSATLLLPPVPNGKWMFIDEIHIAQVSGAGSSPNGFLTDQNLSQLFAVITPDGSTFGASYKSGRNVIPGGINPLITLQSLVNGATYLIGFQGIIKTRIEMPQFDLSSIFGKASGDKKARIYDDGFESHDVTSPHTLKNDMPYGGPYDDSGTLGDF